MNIPGIKTPIVFETTYMIGDDTAQRTSMDPEEVIKYQSLRYGAKLGEDIAAKKEWKLERKPGIDAQIHTMRVFVFTQKELEAYVNAALSKKLNGGK
jgi:hypothetical protein